jgi:hypothetical protein
MMTMINYARALEDDGVFGSAARAGWEKAGKEMRDFAVREIPTTWDVPIRLGLREEELSRASRINEELEKLLPGQFQGMEERLRESLAPEMKEAVAVPPMDRTDAQQRAAYAAGEMTRVSWPMVAKASRNAAKARHIRPRHVYGPCHVISVLSIFVRTRR